MATDIANLKTRRAAITAELAALNTTKAGGLPNASGGESVDHVGYKDGLYRELEQIDKAIQRAGEIAAAESIAADGPFEIEEHGY